jgi:hypothetical protein
VVSVMPLTVADVTASPAGAAPVSEGRAGLLFVQAVVTTRRAQALQKLRDFFMGSYRKCVEKRALPKK